MSIQISVGGEYFDEIRRSGVYYVDKTELLYELVGRTNNRVTLFTRPRRFGKTLNMSMMESFFDINRDSRAMFQGLNIAKHEEFCKEWMNQYPVLFLSLKDVDGLDFDGSYRQLQSALAKNCKTIASRLVGELVDPADLEIFERLRYQNASLPDVKGSLDTLMRMMHAVYGKPVILLIDEYDVPLAKVSEKDTAENRYYEQMLDVIRGMFSVALKTNEHLKFAVVTGCLRIAKESIFTGTNNFASYSVLDDRFSGFFGFTQEEVDALLAAADLSGKASVIKSWYDGYVFGKTPVYCPWDVANYVSALLYDREAEPENYWRNTSGNGVIRDFVGREDLDVTDEFEALMNGGTITETISDELTYDTLHESEQNLWSTLLMTGYLTKAQPQEKGSRVALRIPNAEISGIFEDAVVKLFSDTVDRGQQRELMQAFWHGEPETAAKLLTDFLWDTISYHDYHEDYYHAFLAGLFVGMRYSVKSNRERGLGRFDIRVKDRKNRRAMIIEVKKSDSAGKMDAACTEALKQIVDKGYAREIDPGYKEILCYGIAFFQKFAMVKKL